MQTPNQGCARPHSGPKTHPRAMWKTCPGWSSVLTGLDNSKHHVWDNTPASVQQFWATRLRYGTLFDMVADKHKTLACGRPNVLGYGNAAGILDTTPVTFKQARPVSDQKGDAKNTSFALRHMDKADVLFVHLDALDQAGHRHRWGSKAYMKALQATDVQIGRLVDAIAARPAREEWLVLVTADHGGHGYGHNRVRGKDNCIPFYCNRKLRGTNFTHLDITPTAMKWLGYRKPRHVDGVARPTGRKPVTRVSRKK